MTESTQATPRRWFITGANSGFGDSFVRAALAAGDLVVASVRRPETMAALAEQHPETLTIVRLDVRDAEQAERAVTEAIATYGGIDVLVNNAGYGVVGAVEETTDQEWRDAFEVMFFGAMRLTQLVLPHLRERGSGTIVQVTSMGGLMAYPGNAVYCAAKGALEQASEALAAEVGPLGVRVLIVEPGAFRTPFAGPNVLYSSDAMPEYDATVGPTRRALAAMDGVQPGDPDRAAAALLAVLDQETIPLRLVLGPDAVAAIRKKVGDVLADIERTEAFSLGTDFPAVAAAS